MKKSIYCLFIIPILINFNLAGQSQDQKIKEFDSYVEKSRAEWRAPGMAVAVVKDGKVIFKKGFGIRELGKEDKVDTETLFSGHDQIRRCFPSAVSRPPNGFGNTDRSPRISRVAKRTL